MSPASANQPGSSSRALRPSRLSTTGVSTWPGMFEGIVKEGQHGSRIKLGDSTIPQGGVRVSISSRGSRLREEPFLGTYHFKSESDLQTAMRTFQERVGASCVQIWHTVLSAPPAS